MLQSWVDVEELKRFLPSRQFFEKHARTIAIGVAALALWAAFPIPAIPVFGIAMPLGASWLLLKSMIEDQRSAARSRAAKRSRPPWARQGGSVVWFGDAVDYLKSLRGDYRAAPWLRGPDLN